MVSISMINPKQGILGPYIGSVGCSGVVFEPYIAASRSTDFRLCLSSTDFRLCLSTKHTEIGDVSARSPKPKISRASTYSVGYTGVVLESKLNASHSVEREAVE